MPDFIKLDDITGDNSVQDTTVAPDPNRSSDPIARYLDATIGVDGAETDPNADPKSGAENKDGKDGGKQAADGQASDSGNKDDLGKPGADQKGKKDEGKTGAAGDLTLPDGTVVKAGAERRFYERNKLTESQLSMRSNELQQANQARERLQTELNTLKNTVQSTQGAEPQVVATGVKLVRDLQRDPQGTLRNLLTEAVAAGYTIDGIGAGIDVQSIRDAFQRQLAPLLEAQQQQEQGKQVNTEIEQQVTQFYTQHPDATMHDEVIAAIIAKNPQFSLTDAYYQLRNAVIDRGLDWSKPLGAQLEASEQTQQQPPAKPMPNGRGPNGTSQVADAGRTVVAHESTDMGSIIKAAMRDNGMNI